MSGTSLDGVDVTYATYTKISDKNWEFAIHASNTFEFPEILLSSLHEASKLSGSQLATLDHDLGEFFSSSINQFIEDKAISRKEVDAIASHGQTIFHQPSRGFTTQIGNPAVIAVRTGIRTIGDFRTKDVLYHGQGAPLVPIGDQYLFGSKADGFINIGGFANISFEEKGTVRAYDICPANLPMNKLARAKHLDYDKNGNLARAGELNYFLLDLLNSLDYYQEEGPKSLGTEWLEQHFYPLLKFDKDIENNLATVVEHIAIQLGEICTKKDLKRVMITGGGAKNTFLVERFKRYYTGEIISVDSELVDYKEALIFGLLGALNLNDEPNCLSSVTGATKNVIGGVHHLP
nr:anhydro-N-acetylmuramic acid kinase [uncultured Fluviicola sp.]